VINRFDLISNIKFKWNTFLENDKKKIDPSIKKQSKRGLKLKWRLVYVSGCENSSKPRRR
jgi:hypothetical protein